MSDSHGTLPLSGYAISKVFSLKQHYEVIEKSNGLPKTEEVSFAWDWRIVSDDLFEVLVSITIDPSAARCERFGSHVVGRFRRLAEKPSVDLQAFVTLQAVAILMPYVRQMLSGLTAQSEAGAYYLPVVNVARLMAGMKPENATGAKQLRDEEKPHAMRVRKRRPLKQSAT
jgi:preprotein translocase subunit SecB